MLAAQNGDNPRSVLAERAPPRRRLVAAEAPKPAEEPAGERLLARIKRFLGG